MNKLRIGIVGCGKIAEQHARHIAGTGKAILTAAVEPDPNRLAEFADRYGIERRFPSLESLLDSQTIDVVHLCSPPTQHAAQARLAIEAGLHVFIEKPVALSARETAGLLQLATERGVKICPNFVQLFLPSVAKVSKELKAGNLGRLRSCLCEYSIDLRLSQLKEGIAPNWSLTMEGGILRNFITHPLYLVLRWIGPARRIVVASQHTGKMPQGITDHLDILLAGTVGTGHLVLSMATRPAYQNLMLWCEHGTISVNMSRMTILADRMRSLPSIVDRALGALRQAHSLAAQNIANLWGMARKKIVPYQGMHDLLAEFYDSITTCGPAPVPAELVQAVSEAEDAIVSQIEKTVFECHSTTHPDTQTAPIIVTGATGYVGQEVVKRLRDRGHSVRAMIRPFSDTSTLEALGVELAWGDIRDYDAVARAFHGASAAVHLAAGLKGGTRYIAESCVAGTQNIARAAKENGVGRVIYVSSVSVYDLVAVPEGSVIAENATLESKPELRGASSASKRAAEDIALREICASGWTVLRPGMIFGNRRALLPLLGGVRIGRLFLSFGLPWKRTRLIHVSDVAGVIADVLEHESARGKVFNLAHPDPLTVGQAMKIYRAENPCDPVHAVYVPYAAAALIRYGLLVGRMVMKKLPAVSHKRLVYLFRGVVIDSQLIRKTIGWKSSAPLVAQFREACRPEKTNSPGRWFWAAPSEIEALTDANAREAEVVR